MIAHSPNQQAQSSLGTDVQLDVNSASAVPFHDADKNPTSSPDEVRGVVPASRIDSHTSYNFEVAKVASILVVAIAHFRIGISLWIPATIGLFIFGFSSGYFTALRYQHRFSIREFWNKKLLRLAPNLVVINVFLLGLFVLQGRPGIATWQTPLAMLGLTGWLNWFGIPNASPFGAGLWFFTLLLMFYLAYPLLRQVACSKQLFGAVTLLGLLLSAVLTNRAPMGHMLWLTAWSFLFGVFIAHFQFYVKPIHSVLAAVFVGAVMLLLNTAFHVSQLNYICLALICILPALWLANLQYSLHFLSPLKTLSPCLLEIYFLHTYLFLKPTDKVAANLALSLACIVGVSWLLNRIASTLRVQLLPQTPAT